jgi:hypothetical protein
LYSRTSAISSKIHHDIRFTEDREVLYRRLVKVLTASAKLNKVIEPDVLRGLEQTLNKMKEMRVVKGSLWANTFDGIVKIMRESY